MLNLSSLSTQSLASCVNYFVWNCLTCFFQHENRFRYKFFDIVQFSRSCKRLSLAADDLIILSQKWFFVKLFFRSFSWFRFLWRTWSVLGFSALAGTFGRLLVLFTLLPAGTQKSFFCLSAWRSSIIPHLPPSVNTFRQVFSMFFVNHSGVRKSSSFECPPLRAGHLQRQLLLSLQPAQNGPFTRWAVMTGSRCGPVPDFPI